MAAPEAPSGQAATDEVARTLDAAIAETRRLGRQDLTERLRSERAAYLGGSWHVLVVGEFKKGKSSLVDALLGVRVCGADPVEFGAVPIVLRHGVAPSAALVPGGRPRRPIAPGDVPRYARTGLDDDGEHLSAIELALPRKLLAGGMVLIDTPGMGGGFAAAGAAATMRAISVADAVLIVSDASQEFTAAEIELMRHAAAFNRQMLCLLTKIDLYPRWQRVLEIDRGHLHRAGLAMDVVPVSSTLRQFAAAGNDAAMNVESGFPVLVRRLRSQVEQERSTVWGPRAMKAARDCLGQLAETLDTEHTALARPAARPGTIAQIDAGQRRAAQLGAPGARWLNVMQDRFVDIQTQVEDDLQMRIRRLEQEALSQIKAHDPTTEWIEFVPWLHRRTNEELACGHTRMLSQIAEAAAEVTALFDGQASEVDCLVGETRPSAGSTDLALGQLASRGPGRFELGMHAARGWSLSSSVITTLLVTTLHPGLLVVLPVTAVLGTVVAVKTVLGVKSARLEAARAEAARIVTSYLHQSRIDATRSAAFLLRQSRNRLRDHCLDRAAELATTARASLAAATSAASIDPVLASDRASETSQRLARIRALAARARTVEEAAR